MWNSCSKLLTCFTIIFCLPIQNSGLVLWDLDTNGKQFKNYNHKDRNLSQRGNNVPEGPSHLMKYFKSLQGIWYSLHQKKQFVIDTIGSSFESWKTMKQNRFVFKLACCLHKYWLNKSTKALFSLPESCFKASIKSTFLHSPWIFKPIALHVSCFHSILSRFYLIYSTIFLCRNSQMQSKICWNFRGF